VGIRYSRYSILPGYISERKISIHETLHVFLVDCAVGYTVLGVVVNSAELTTVKNVTLLGQHYWKLV
jgi:hypothetical protein